MYFVVIVMTKENKTSSISQDYDKSIKTFSLHTGKGSGLVHHLAYQGVIN